MVDINNTSSDFEKVKSGMPRGNILHPLSFLCYVNGMSMTIDGDTSSNKYDDIAVLYWKSVSCSK